MLRIAPLIVVCTIALCLADSCRAADRVALVIGNSNYPGDAALKNPSNDADLLEAALKDLGFSVTKKKDLTREQMEDALVEFLKNMPKRGLALFYYAGHGLQVEGANFLVPVDARIRTESEVKRQCLPADQVLDTMGESESNLKVLILDCCRNNPFKRGWKRGLGDHGLAAMSEVPEGTIIAYSTAPKKAADDGDGKNSPYAEQLAATLRSRPANGLELKDVFFKSSQHVKRATGQQPWLNMEGSIEDYFLRPAGEQGTGPEGGPKNAPADARWTTLFNGKDLTGWNVDGGKPEQWSAAGTEIVGRSDTYKTRCYLLSNKDYADYDLRFEFRIEGIDDHGGVAIRAVPGETAPLGNKMIFDHPIIKLRNRKQGNESIGTTHFVKNAEINTAPVETLAWDPGTWHGMEISVRGDRCRATVGDKPVVDIRLDQKLAGEFVPGLARSRGKVGFQINTGTLRLRNIEIRELPAGPKS